MKLNTGITHPRDFSGAMTDISFLLIVFFLVSMVFIADTGLLLSLPEENSVPKEMPEEEVLALTLNENQILMHGEERIEKKRVGILAKEMKDRGVNPVLILTIEKGNPYQDVLNIMEEAKKGGIKLFSLNTPEESPIPVALDKENNETAY